MDIITNIVEDIMLVFTDDKVINFRGSVFNAGRKWWRANKEKVNQADYVMVVVDNIVQEVYKPVKKTWHLETDPGNDIKSPFENERWVFGIKDDVDEGEYSKSMLAPEPIRQKYVNKELGELYRWGKNHQNPVKYSF